MHEVGQEDGGSQVSPGSTTPLPHVIVPPLPPDPGTPPVCGVPPVARPPVLDSPPVAGEPPAPPEPLDRVPAPPAPPEPLDRVPAPPAPPEPLDRVPAPPAPPEPLDRVPAPPAPPAPANADVPPGLPPSTGFDAALVPPCPPWPPVMDAVASAWTLASPPGSLPASVFPGRPPLFRLQPRNETKTPGMKKTTAIRCMARLLGIRRGSVADSGPRTRRV